MKVDPGKGNGPVAGLASKAATQTASMTVPSPIGFVSVGLLSAEKSMVTVPGVRGVVECPR